MLGWWAGKSGVVSISYKIELIAYRMHIINIYMEQ